MDHRKKVNELMLLLRQDPWYQWVIKQPHKGVSPVTPNFLPGSYFSYNRIYVQDYDDWYNLGATLVVKELERRNPEEVGTFITPRKVARFLWPSRMDSFNLWHQRAHQLARITNNDIDQADVDIMAARFLYRLKELWDKGELYRSTQVERRKHPRSKTDFARRGQGYTKWKTPTTEPTITQMIPFKINSSSPL